MNLTLNTFKNQYSKVSCNTDIILIALILVEGNSFWFTQHNFCLVEQLQLSFNCPAFPISLCCQSMISLPVLWQCLGRVVLERSVDPHAMATHNIFVYYLNFWTLVQGSSVLILDQVTEVRKMQHRGKRKYQVKSKFSHFVGLTLLIYSICYILLFSNLIGQLRSGAHPLW